MSWDDINQLSWNDLLGRISQIVVRAATLTYSYLSDSCIALLQELASEV